MVFNLRRQLRLPTAILRGRRWPRLKLLLGAGLLLLLGNTVLHAVRPTQESKYSARRLLGTSHTPASPPTDSKASFNHSARIAKKDPWSFLRVPHGVHQHVIGGLRQQAAGYVQALTAAMAPIRTAQQRKGLCDSLKSDPHAVYSLQKTLQGAEGEYDCKLSISGNLCRPPPQNIFQVPRAAPGKKPRILCWVLSSIKDKRKDNVRDTWAKRCDLTIFAAGKDSLYPTLGLFVPDDRMHLASKTVAMWTYIYLHFLDDYDFFFKADPDTYVVVDNLRKFLRDKDPEQPLYFGNQFHIYDIPWWRFAAGGPGEVLSRTSVRVLVEHSYRRHCASCVPDGKCEDCKLARCLSMGGINISDSRDSRGREHFLPMMPEKHLFLQKGGGFYGQYNLFDTKGGHECCAEYPVSFHYVKGPQMFLLDYLLYRWKVAPHDEEDFDSYPKLPNFQLTDP